MKSWIKRNYEHEWKVGDLVSYYCRGPDGDAAHGIVVAKLPEGSSDGDVRVKWFDYDGRKGAFTNQSQTELCAPLKTITLC